MERIDLLSRQPVTPCGNFTHGLLATDALLDQRRAAGADKRERAPAISSARSKSSTCH